MILARKQQRGKHQYLFILVIPSDKLINARRGHQQSSGLRMRCYMAPDPFSCECRAVNLTDRLYPDEINAQRNGNPRIPYTG